MRTGILLTDEPPPEARKVLSEFDVFILPADDATIARCRILMGFPSRVKPDLVRRMGKLEMIQSVSAGVDALPLKEIPPSVRIFSNAGGYTEPVAEHAWGLLLGLAKGLHSRNRRVVPRKLRNKTLLVVGAGEIGSEVANMSRSLGMKTVGVSRSFKHPESFDERHSPAELRDTIGRADAVVLALPLNRETRGLFAYELLMLSNENVLIVNVGRGETVVQEGLTMWLKERPESRYATDVFWKREGKEVFDTEAWDLPNFGGTLHSSGLPLGEPLVVPFLRASENVKRYLLTGGASNEVERSDYD